MEPMVMKQPTSYGEPVAYTNSEAMTIQMPNQPTLQPAPPVTVITSQPPTTVINMMQSNFIYPRGLPRDWSTPLCGCFEDCLGCCCALMCMPCYECHVASKMGECCCVPCCMPNATLVMRAHLRGRHNIQGSLINDACTVCWCTSCALCQVSREIDNIKFGRAAP